MNQHVWHARLGVYPFAQPFLVGWQIADRSQDPHWTAFEQALDTYLASQDETCPLPDRLRSLIESRDRARTLRAQGDGHIATRLVLLRCLNDLGEEAAAANELRELLRGMPWLAEPLPDDLQININRPFLAPISAFDARPVRGDLGQWLQAAVIEALERKKALSSYFHTDLNLLKVVLDNPNHTQEMARRHRLLSLRLGLPVGTSASVLDLSDRNTGAWQVLADVANR